MRKRLVAGGAAVVAAVLLSGCATATGATAPPGVCEGWVDSDAAGSVLLDLGEPGITPDRARDITKRFWTAEEPILAAMEPKAPDEIRGAVATLLRTARAGAASGDPATLATPELGQADASIDRYALRECGYPELRITATDYAFHGLPPQVPAGTVAVTLVNQGRDLHQAVVSRVNDGVTQTLPEILALPLDQQLKLVTPLMATQSAPGETTTMFLRLRPGRHALVDTYPEGTVDPTAPGSGPAHTALGMAAEFTVT